MSHAEGAVNEVKTETITGEGGDGNPLPALMKSDHPRIVSFLRGQLTKKELIDVGVTLGLDYIHLANMNPDSLHQDMVHSWLRKDDNVLKESGPPTWGSLVKALEQNGLKGVAATIKESMKL